MSEKIKATMSDRAAAIRNKVMAKFDDVLKLSNWSKMDLAKAAGVELADIEMIMAGGGAVQPWLAAMNALRLELSALAEGDYLAQRLANTRELTSLSAEKVCQKANLPVATLKDLENGGGDLCDLFLLLAAIAPRTGCRTRKNGFGKRDKIDGDSRFTSPALWEPVVAAFGPIDKDPCGHKQSTVVAADRIMLSEGRDGMTEDWCGRVVFVNPPFSRQLEFLSRAYDQWACGNAEVIICVVPNKTCNNPFHEKLYNAADFYMVKGRPQFGDVNDKWEETKYSLMFVIFGGTPRQKARFGKLVQGKWARFYDNKPLVSHYGSGRGGEEQSMSCGNSGTALGVHCGAGILMTVAV